MEWLCSIFFLKKKRNFLGSAKKTFFHKMSFIHLSQIEKFYQNRSLKISMQKPSKVSIDEIVHESTQLQISEIGAKIEQAVQKGNFREEAELVLNLLDILNSDETSAIYGFDLGETVVRCSEFMEKLSFAQKYSLHISSAQGGQIFFNSPSVAYLNCGTSMVVDAYQRAVACAVRHNRDDSLAKNSILTVQQNVKKSKKINSEERDRIAQERKELQQILKRAKKNN